jgi:glutamyl/glutaminyl-tRNA synthetase
LTEFFEQGRYFFDDPPEYDPEAAAKHWPDASAAKTLDGIAADLAAGTGWDAAGIENAVRALADGLKVKAGQVIHPVRLALTGSGASPGLFEMMEALGRETVLRRLKRAAERIRANTGGDHF